MNQITLHDLNDPDAREVISAAPTVLFVDPNTGYSRVVVGQALVEAARQSGDPEARVGCVRISVEEERGELELATAAILAIRGAVDNETAEQELGRLSEMIRKYWNQGLNVPWTEMLQTWRS